MSLLTFLRSFQNMPGFANIALHCWGGGLFTLFALEHAPIGHVVPAAIALAAAKEFYFDMRYEIPPQQIGSIASGGALQDFFGYALGIALAVALHFV